MGEKDRKFSSLSPRSIDHATCRLKQEPSRHILNLDNFRLRIRKAGAALPKRPELPKLPKSP